MRLTALLAIATLTAGPAFAQASGAIAAPHASAAAPQSPAVTAQAEVAAAASAVPAGTDVAGDVVNEIEFGARLNSLGDVGRFQRYVDLRSGLTLDHVRFGRGHDTWAFDAQAESVGYRDQRYRVNADRFGRIKSSFEFLQVPILYGTVNQTPFREEAPGVFRLNDTIQAAVENKTGTLVSFAPELQQFELRSRRDTSTGVLQYSATRNLDLTVVFVSSKRTGQQPWGASFGFSDATEVPVTIDRRTNNVTAAADWSRGRGTVRLAYEGSWFNNHVDTLVWDNPLRVTDTTNANAYSTGDGSSQGREALWPDSTAHTVSASGSLVLPARTRAFAYVSVGSWLQNEQLLPFTINSAIPPIPLSRPSAEAEALITSMSYRFTSRPTQRLWVSGQFRLYDFDNRTPRFAVDDYVRLDGTVAPSATGGSEPFGYTRRFYDLDASYTPFRFVAFRAGYGQESDDRTFRYVDRTTDHTVRASVDSTAFAWGSVRLQYDRSERTGTGLDEQALSDIGEQVSLRQFDIANRTRDRVSAILQFVPVNMIGFTASTSVARERRPESAFGLQDNDVKAATVGVDFTPGTLMTASLAYSFEAYATLQQSRQANPGDQFNDPTRDWSTDMDEHVHTVSASLDLPQLAPRTSFRAGYDLVRSNARYLYLLRPDTTLPPVQQLPNVLNSFQLTTADLRYALSRRTAVALGYRLDHYNVEDFALTPGILNTSLIPTYLNLGYQWRPYTSHTGSIRLIYHW